MRRTIPVIVCCAALALLSSQAQAKDKNQNEGQGQNQSSGSSGGGQWRQNAQLQQATAQEFFLASNMTGKNTQDSRGNKIGSIKQIAFNQKGEVFALLDIGNGKWAVVPWQAVNPGSATGNGNVTINATQQQLQAGPTVTQNEWGALDNPTFAQACYTYYHVQPPSAAGGSSSPGGAAEGQGQSSGSSSGGSQGSGQQSQEQH